MKPAITTEYVHTINFYTATYQAEHRLGGLDALIQESAHRTIDFSTTSIHQKLVSTSLKDIMPEVLDEFSYQRLEQIFNNGIIEVLDIRLIIQWLVNKEVLPSGSYLVAF